MLRLAGTEPELDATLAEVDDGLRHVAVAALVLKDSVPMGEADDVRNALRVEEVFRGGPW